MEAVQWAKDVRMDRMEFELDSKLVMDDVTKDNININWRLRNLILYIKALFNAFDLWHRRYVPKEKKITIIL